MPDEPMTNEPLPVPPDETGLASGREPDPPASHGPVAPEASETGHDAFDRARAETARRQEAL